MSASTGQVVLSWPAAASGFFLESATNLPAVSWTMISAATNLVGNNLVVTLPASDPRKFFRLHKQ